MPRSRSLRSGPCWTATVRPLAGHLAGTRTHGRPRGPASDAAAWHHARAACTPVATADCGRHRTFGGAYQTGGQGLWTRGNPEKKDTA